MSLELLEAQRPAWETNRSAACHFFWHGGQWEDSFCIVLVKLRSFGVESCVLEARVAYQTLRRSDRLLDPFFGTIDPRDALRDGELEAIYAIVDAIELERRL